MSVWVFRVVLGLTAAAVACGCGDDGPPTYKVTGVVTYDGAPLEKGTILFLPEDGRGTLQTGPIVDGEYSVLVTAGRKRVEIRAPKESDVKIQTMPIVSPDGKRMEHPPLMVESIPAKYNVNSTLNAEIKPEDNELNFDLEKGEVARPEFPPAIPFTR